MKRVQLSNNKWNYLKDDETYLLDEHVKFCCEFSEGFGSIVYNNNTFNCVNKEGKKLLKYNVEYNGSFIDGLALVLIYDGVYYNINKSELDFYYNIDKECNFYNSDKVSFKELYNEFPNMRSELIEIIEKYTFFNVNDYFNI